MDKPSADNEVTTQRGRMDDEKPYERTPYSTWLHTPLARGNPNEEGCAQVCASCRGSNYSEPVVLPINLTTRFEHGDEGQPLARAFSHPPNHANHLKSQDSTPASFAVGHVGGFPTRYGGERPCPPLRPRPG